MFTRWMLMSAASLVALATAFTAPREVKAQYYAPWYSYYPGTYYSWPSYWGGGYYYPYYWNGSYPQSYSSFYTEPQDTSKNASITVQVPADAQVWFGNVLTRQQGTERNFVSPPLKAGAPYVYDIRARWTENGKVVERTRQVKVSSGEQVRVDFSGEKVPLPAEPAGRVKPAPSPTVANP